jgi:hypothetical protein
MSVEKIQLILCVVWTYFTLPTILILWIVKCLGQYKMREVYRCRYREYVEDYQACAELGYCQDPDDIRAYVKKKAAWEAVINGWADWRKGVDGNMYAILRES